MHDRVARDGPETSVWAIALGVLSVTDVAAHACRSGSLKRVDHYVPDRSRSLLAGSVFELRVTSNRSLWITFGEGHGRNWIGKKLGQSGVLMAVDDELMALQHDPILLLWREWTDTTELNIVLTIDDAPDEHGLRPGLSVRRRTPIVNADLVWSSEEAEAKLFSGTPAEAARAIVAEIAARVEPRLSGARAAAADSPDSDEQSILEVRVPFRPGESWLNRIDDIVDELTEQVWAGRAGEVDGADEEGDEISFMLLGGKREPLMKAARIVLTRFSLLDGAYAIWQDAKLETTERLKFRR